MKKTVWLFSVPIILFISAFIVWMKEEDKDYLAYSGLTARNAEEMAELYYDGKIPDANSARILELALELEKINMDVDVMISSTKQENNTGAAQEKYQRESIEKFQKLYPELKSIFSERRIFKFQRDYSKPFMILLPEFQCFRSAAKGFLLHGLDAIRLNDLKTAWTDYECLQNIEQTLAEDKYFLITGLVAVGCCNYRIFLLKHMIRSEKLNDEELTRIQYDMLETEKRLLNLLQNAIRGEAWCSIFICTQIIRDKHSISELAGIDTSSGNIWNSLQKWKTFLNSGSYRVDRRLIAEYYSKIIVHADNAGKEPVFQLPDDTLRKAILAKGGKLSHCLLPSMNTCFAKYYSQIAHCRMAWIACEIERFRQKNNGTRPERLSDLGRNDLPLDPYAGKDFFYLRKGTEFQLRGVGKNLKDDGEENYLSKNDDVF